LGTTNLYVGNWPIASFRVRATIRPLSGQSGNQVAGRTGCIGREWTKADVYHPLVREDFGRICAAPFRGEFHFAEGKLVKARLARQNSRRAGPCSRFY
jgi:hypothetical protein